MNYKDYFKGKKIAIIGLGMQGEMIPDIKFLNSLKANLSIYDTRSRERLTQFTKKLGNKYFKDIHTGKIKDDELISKDLIILSSDVHPKSIFLKKAKEANVPIEYQEILFLKYAPNITLVGIAGSYGKTAIFKLVNEMFSNTFKNDSNQNFFLINHESSSGYISNLKKIKPGDIVVSLIEGNMISEYKNAHINPHVAVITSLTSNGVGSDNEVFGLLEFQTYNNFIIAPDTVIDILRNKAGFTARAKIFRTRTGSIPNEWNLINKTIQDRENISLALQVGEIFKVDKDTARDIALNFNGVKGQAELVRVVKGVEYYNDAASTSPGSTYSAINMLSKDQDIKNMILIMGGAYTGYEYDSLLKLIGEKIRIVVCLPGSGTVGLRNELQSSKGLIFKQAFDLKEAIDIAYENAEKGDRVIFSPACIPLGIFENRQDRITKFNKIIKSLK